MRNRVKIPNKFKYMYNYLVLPFIGLPNPS